MHTKKTKKVISDMGPREKVSVRLSPQIKLDFSIWLAQHNQTAQDVLVSAITNLIKR